MKQVKRQNKRKLNIKLWMDARHVEKVWKMETSIYSLVNEDFNVSQLGKYMEAHISCIILQMLHQTITLTHTCYIFNYHPHHCFSFMRDEVFVY